MATGFKIASKGAVAPLAAVALNSDSTVSQVKFDANKNPLGVVIASDIQNLEQDSAALAFDNKNSRVWVVRKKGSTLYARPYGFRNYNLLPLAEEASIGSTYSSYQYNVGYDENSDQLIVYRVKNNQEAHFTACYLENGQVVKGVDKLNPGKLITSAHLIYSPAGKCMIMVGKDYTSNNYGQQVALPIFCADRNTMDIKSKTSTLDGGSAYVSIIPYRVPAVNEDVSEIMHVYERRVSGGNTYHARVVKVAADATVSVGATFTLPTSVVMRGVLYNKDIDRYVVARIAGVDYSYNVLAVNSSGNVSLEATFVDEPIATIDHPNHPETGKHYRIQDGAMARYDLTLNSLTKVRLTTAPILPGSVYGLVGWIKDGALNKYFLMAYYQDRFILFDPEGNETNATKVRLAGYNSDNAVTDGGEVEVSFVFGDPHIVDTEHTDLVNGKGYYMQPDGTLTDQPFNSDMPYVGEAYGNSKLLIK